jgi:hypothetical protein
MRVLDDIQWTDSQTFGKRFRGIYIGHIGAKGITKIGDCFPFFSKLALLANDIWNIVKTQTAYKFFLTKRGHNQKLRKIAGKNRFGAKVIN